MDSQIRQEGESDDKTISLNERPEFHIHTYADANFSMSGGRSRSGFWVCLVNPATGDYYNGPQGDKPLPLTLRLKPRLWPCPMAS